MDGNGIVSRLENRAGKPPSPKAENGTASELKSCGSITFQIQSENARGKGLGNLACLPAGKRRVLMVEMAILEELPRGVDFGTGFLVDSMTFETQPENARGIRLQSRAQF